MSNYKRKNKWHCHIGWRSASIVTYPHSLTHSLTHWSYNKVVSPQIIQEAVATKMIRMILSIHYSLLYPNSQLESHVQCCDILRFAYWPDTKRYHGHLHKCHGDINFDEVLEVKDKACNLRLRWRTTFTTTPPNNKIGRSNTGKLNGYLSIKSTAMLLCLTERWTLSRRILPKIVGAVC